MAETRHMTKSSSHLARAELLRASPTSIASGPDGDHRRLSEFFCEISMRVTVHSDRNRQRSPIGSVLLDIQLRQRSPAPMSHEFNRVRLLKTFGSRSEKNASTQIPPRNRKNAAITLGFRSSTPRHRPRRFRQRFDSTGQFTIRTQFNLP